MQIHFFKYEGAGNDFILINNFNDQLQEIPSSAIIAHWCDRHFGIGADGCILLMPSQNADFSMLYFNADGNQSSLCGNGGRCVVAFAHQQGIIQQETTFEAIDGLHFAELLEGGNQVRLNMQKVAKVKVASDFCFVNTGSPHHLVFLEAQSALENLDVVGTGRKIRTSSLYDSEGTNVNFIVQKGAAVFSIRTYERGVENETLACGTGAVAAALGAFALKKTKATKIQLEAPGGLLEVAFTPNADGYKNITLTGPVQFVFQGTIEDSMA